MTSYTHPHSPLPLPLPIGRQQGGMYSYQYYTEMTYQHSTPASFLSPTGRGRIILLTTHHLHSRSQSGEFIDREYNILFVNPKYYISLPLTFTTPDTASARSSSLTIPSRRIIYNLEHCTYKIITILIMLISYSLHSL